MALLLMPTLFLVACEAVTPTPRPTRTRVIATETVEPADTPTVVPTRGPLATATAAAGSTPRAAVAAAPKPIVTDPLLPIFAPFPPKPIPSRPSNINPLTGLTVDPAALQRRPILARIGNDQKVRESFWQAGLNSADIVFEELIDILGSQYANTRYTAVFLSNDPPLIGPIRSGRIINFQLVPMLDGALSHAGASNGTRWLFSQSPMTNIDEFFNQPAYCYINSHGYQGRLYTTVPRLRQWLTQKGWEEPVQLYGFNFADGVPSGQPITSIGFNKAPWPSWDAAQWTYAASSGKYMRSSTGAPVMDTTYAVTAKWGNGADCVPSGAQTQSQVNAANVVVLYAQHEKTDIIEDSNNAVSVHVILTGQGDATFFRDGVMVNGKWQRKTEQEFFSLTDAAGNPYNLKPGNTFFELVPIGYKMDLK
ncbi:MAG TPA: DUF3048 domain-containing protein [Anaerolineae bacterium]